MFVSHSHFKVYCFSLPKATQTMADDSSVLPSPTEITSLADSSVFDSKVTETSKENLCLAPTSNVDGKPGTCFCKHTC